MSNKPFFTLIRNVRLWNPENCGISNILFAGDSIAATGPDLDPVGLENIEYVEGDGLHLVPGFVDSHIHLAGGGGEGGFSTRIAPASPEHVRQNGVCSVVGLLGTDSITRSLEDLFACTQVFSEAGLSAWMYSGAYRVPCPTITGSIQKDIVLIKPIIGIGEIAIGDHRSSHPDFGELLRIISDARIGGMISGKAGITHFHLGSHTSAAEMLLRILKESAIPASQLYPTHINRNRDVLESMKTLVRAGIPLDITAGFGSDDSELNAGDVLEYFMEHDLPFHQLSLSSDSYGSIPVFNSKGELECIQAAGPELLLDELQALIVAGYDFARILPLVTSNPARILGLPRVGMLRPGYLAHAVLCTESLEIIRVWTSGR
ncbi:beta-aspartyl-peptidase [Spirochaeta dissipatitropha]